MKTMSLNSKVMLIITILVASSLSIGCVGLSRMAMVNGYLTEITGTLIRRDELAASLLDRQRQVTILHLSYGVHKDAEKRRAYLSQLTQASELLLNDVEEYRKVASAEGQELASRYLGSAKQWLEGNQKARELLAEGRDEEFDRVSEADVEPHRQEALDVLKSIKSLTGKRIEETTHASAEAYRTAFRLVLSAAASSILLGLLLAALVLRSLSRSINAVISELTDNAQQVSSAFRRIASSSEELSEASAEQAASLDQTAASLQKMSAMAQQGAESASITARLASASQEGAQRGQQVVAQMIQVISEINASNSAVMAQIEQSNQSIGEIVKVIGQIGDKTTVINDIVFQTKLLSFNASVEAARAGEHGRGFAVVAEEIGNLARMSGASAREISSMLEESIQKVEGIVSATRSKVDALVQGGRQKVEQGNRIARECSTVLSEIVQSIDSVNQRSVETSNACAEQAAGVSELNRAMTQLKQATRANAAASEGAASSAEALSAQSGALETVVETLIATLKGGTPRQPEPAVMPREPSQAEVRRPEPSAKVLQFKPKANAKPKSSISPPASGAGALREAVGAGDPVPSEDDPRFEDV